MFRVHEIILLVLDLHRSRRVEVNENALILFADDDQDLHLFIPNHRRRSNDLRVDHDGDLRRSIPIPNDQMTGILQLKETCPGVIPENRGSQVEVQQTTIVLRFRIAETFGQSRRSSQTFGQIDFQIGRLREKEAFGRGNDVVDEHFVCTTDGGQNALSFVQRHVQRREETRTEAFRLNGIRAEKTIEGGQRRRTMFVSAIQRGKELLFQLSEEDIARRNHRLRSVRLRRRLEGIDDAGDEHWRE